ncbi:dienelactone hydrolase family protein [Sneathiella limimaris]|uniref:dienelactone hydrolase family protein n=1 Tax=Sneathiella limimaris TaxID=1964213 RepID=UPI00146E0BC2|nr:dienelactone hydrolase family protein [Sneathiella limimaris]
MGNFVDLKAEDGHDLMAYVAKAEGNAKGAIVIIQEIFGVNPHIQSVCDGYAKAGYTAIAPALFDRIKPGIELGYTEEGVKTGLEYKNTIEPDTALKDVKAAVDYISSVGKVTVIGYCWGGLLTYLSACKLDGIFKAVGYYGGGIGNYVDNTPQVPTLLHFGDQDHAIPLDEVEAVKKAHPEVEVHIYAAGHGFNCDARGSYDKASADLALDRTLKFIEGA